MTPSVSSPKPAGRIHGDARACLQTATTMAARAAKQAANDNAASRGALFEGAHYKGDCDNGATGFAASDKMLRAALRHFAEHGLGAAREARARAEQAFFDGDRPAYDWWLGITRTLDRRLANETARDHVRPTLEII